MHKALKNLGLFAWAGCLFTLIIQGLAWAITGSAPSFSLLSIVSALFSWDLTSLVRSLPLEYAVKTAYVLATTELALALWWLGVACFGLALLWNVFRK